MTRNRKPIPIYYWPLWMSILAAALIVFYGFLTPIWMLIRLVAWVSERRLPRPRAETGISS
jgi:hypothetical protein